MVNEATGDRRRVVPSPLLLKILGLEPIRALMDAGHIVICAGGGGIPVRRAANGQMEGVEAVIDKDRTAALLAQNLKADALLLLTDVSAVFRDLGAPDPLEIGRTTPSALDTLSLPPGSMGPKVAAACGFVQATGGFAGIGCLKDAPGILTGLAGTRIYPESAKTGRSAVPQPESAKTSVTDQPGSVSPDDGGAMI